LPNHLPIVFAVIAFWTGAGGWIVVTYGALNNIPYELLEAAALDGASAWQTALRVKLPLIKKWVVYMLILAFAAGTQLFVEPQLVSEASLGLVSQTWSPNELAYYLAFQNDNFNGAAAVSVDLLIVGLLVAAVLVFRTKLFEVD
jgi:multiple sugar transport system permease protein